MGLYVKVQLEAFSRWSREALERGLFEAHWREVGEDIEEIPLELDLEKLLMLERAGMLAGFSARTDEGALAGYAMMICSTHINYRAHVFAVSHAIYMAPEHRGKGLDLIRLVEREMRGRGISKIVFLEKEGSGFGLVLKGMGYRRSETAWGKLL